MDDEKMMQKMRSMPLSEAEIALAFRFFAGGGDVVTVDNLARFTDLLIPSLSRKDLRELTGPNGIRVGELIKLMKEEHLSGPFDPAAAAFAAFDPTNNGHVDDGHVRNVLRRTGMGEITLAELHMLLSDPDVDRDNDGVLGLSDFRELGMGLLAGVESPRHGRARGSMDGAGASKTSPPAARRSGRS